MELYFLRHAMAAEPGTVDITHDSERPLTSEGIEKMKEEARGMQCMGLTFDQVVSSPYMRAAETAEIVTKGLKFKGKIKFTDLLIPNAEFKTFFKLLKEFQVDDKVLLVGHLPSLEEFTSRLISGQSTAAMDYKQGSLCRIDMPPTIVPGVTGQLKWFLAPKQLRSFR